MTRTFFFAFLFVAALSVVGCTQKPVDVVTLSAIETTPLPVQSKKVATTQPMPNKFDLQLKDIKAVKVKQREETWCWAACAQMLHRYSGTDVSQEKIVMAIKDRESRGDISKQVACEMEILFAMRPDMLLEQYRREHAWDHLAKPNTIAVNAHMNLTNLNDVANSFTTPSKDAIVQNLSRGCPLIMGLRNGHWGTGHAVLVYGVEYSRLKPQGAAAYRDLSSVVHRFWEDYYIHKVYIIDPQPDDDNPESQFREIANTELTQCLDFVVGTDDAAAKLLSYLKVYYPTPEEMPKGK